MLRVQLERIGRKMIRLSLGHGRRLGVAIPLLLRVQGLLVLPVEYLGACSGIVSQPAPGDDRRRLSLGFHLCSLIFEFFLNLKFKYV